MLFVIDLVAIDKKVIDMKALNQAIREAGRVF